MPKFATKTAARETLNRYKADTAYFPEEGQNALSMESMKDMLRNDMRFGVAETNCILAALVLAGAKFNKKGVEEWAK